MYWRLSAPPATADDPAEVPVWTPVRRPPRRRIATPGVIYICALLFMAAAAFNTGVSLLFGVFGLMCGTILVCIRIGKIVLRRLTVTRDLPEAGAVNEPLSVTYRFTNGKGFWATISVSLDEIDGAQGFVRQPRAYLVHAPPKGTVAVPVTLVPKRRGLHAFDRYALSTGFPFGFLRQAKYRRQADAVAVYPAVGAVDGRVMELCQPAERSGPTIRPQRGGSDELYGLKEFRTGENPRAIHWRRSARTGVLVAKEMTQVAPPRVLLLVDTHIDVKGAGRTRAAHARVEEAIAMAASVAGHALEQGVSVGLMAWGGAVVTKAAADEAGDASADDDGGWVAIAPTRGKRQRRDVMTALARLPLNTTHAVADLIAHSRELMEPGTTALLFGSAAAGTLQSAGESGRGSVVSLAVDDPQTRAWFTFPPAVRFDRCCPPEQEEGIEE